MNIVVKQFNGHDLRMFEKNGNVFFCLSDIGKILELSNIYRSASQYKGSQTVTILTNGGAQEMIFVTEPSLYRLIFRSKKEEAKSFQDWVFSDVLPAIRKTGEYSISKELKCKSTKARNLMTEAWKENGVETPIEEYKQLKIETGKRKKDFNKKELLLLQALEALETLNLYYNPVKGFIECKSSLVSTALNVKNIAKD